MSLKKARLGSLADQLEAEEAEEALKLASEKAKEETLTKKKRQGHN